MNNRYYKIKIYLKQERKGVERDLGSDSKDFRGSRHLDDLPSLAAGITEIDLDPCSHCFSFSFLLLLSIKVNRMC